MKKIMVLAIAVSSMAMAGCGQRVEVPPAAKGVIIGKNGIQPKVIPTSKFRLSPCFAYCDKLAVVSASDVKIYEQKMPLFMPKDKLNIYVDLRGTATIPQDDKTILSLISKVAAKPVNVDKFGYHMFIDANKIYDLYGRQAVRGVVRSILVKYTIQELMENRDRISHEIFQAVNNRLVQSKTPLIISRLELANIEPPAVVLQAQEAAAKRRIEIDREKADIRIKMLKAEGELKVAKAERAVKREQALAIAEENRIAAQSVTPALLKYRQLEVFQKVLPEIAKGGNLIVVPVDMSVASTAMDSAVFSRILKSQIQKNKKHATKTH